MFQRIKNFDYGMERIKNSYENTKNIIVDRNSFRIHKLTPSSGIFAVGGQEYRANNYSVIRLCSELGIPIRFVEKMTSLGLTEKMTETAQEMVQAYDRLSEDPVKRIIRVEGDKMKGIVSPSYAAVDNYRIMNTVDKAFNSTNLSLKRMYMDDVSLKADFIMDEKSFYIGNDLYYPGISVTNNEVGYGRMGIYMLVYRQICDNGMIASIDDFDLGSVVHRGKSRNNEPLFTEIPQYDLNNIEINPDKIREACIESLEENMDMVKAGLRQALKQQLFNSNAVNNSESLVKKAMSKALRQNFNQITSETANSFFKYAVQSAIQLGKDKVSMYDIINGFTLYAQDINDPIGKQSMEELGFRLAVDNTKAQKLEKNYKENLNELMVA